MTQVSCYKFRLTYFSVTLTSLARIQLFNDAIFASASVDSGAKSDLHETGTDLRNNKEREMKVNHIKLTT